MNFYRAGPSIFDAIAAAARSEGMGEFTYSDRKVSIDAVTLRMAVVDFLLANSTGTTPKSIILSVLDAREEGERTGAGGVDVLLDEDEDLASSVAAPVPEIFNEPLDKSSLICSVASGLLKIPIVVANREIMNAAARAGRDAAKFLVVLPESSVRPDGDVADFISTEPSSAWCFARRRESEAEPGLESEAEPKSTTKPKPKPKPKLKSKSKPELKPEPKPEPGPKPKLKSKLKSKPKPEPEPKPGPGSELEAGAGSEPKPGPGSELEAGAEPESDLPKRKAQSKIKLKPKAEPSEPEKKRETKARARA